MTKKHKVTGDCFEASGKAILDLLRDPTATKDRWYLCHGIVAGQGPIEGLFIRHAWVEYFEQRLMDETRAVLALSGRGGYTPQVDETARFLATVCIDKTNGNDIQLPAPVYYSVGQIDKKYVRRYTLTEARAMICKHRHWGAWDLPDVIEDGIEVH